MPLAGDALERVSAAVREPEPRAGDEVAPRARPQALAGPGERRDAGADVHGDPAELRPHHLTFARVEAGADLEAERAHALADRARGPHRARRAIEGREEAVASRVDLAPAELRQVLAHQRVVGVEQVAPLAVAQLGGLRRGSDDV